MLVVDSSIVTQFLTMESLLDESVGSEINLQIERGGTPLTVKLKVGDLHSITPNHFLEVSGAVIHPLSYQQARNFGFKCGLVYVAEPGYMLSRASVPRYSIIKKFARKDIAHLGDFIAVISELSRGERVPLEYVTYTDRHRNKHTIVTIDQRGWYATPQLYTRNDATGLWIAKSAMLLESPYVVSIHQRGHRDVNSNVDENIAVEGTVSSSRDLDDIKGVSRHSSSMEGSSLAEQVIKPALVKFEVCVPPICMIDGVHAKHFTGAGVVIFLHPFHNFALVAYDPSTLGVGASVIRASKLLTEPALRRGDSVYLVRLIDSLHAKSRKSIVTNWQAVNICSSDFPRYRAINTEVIELDTDSVIELSGVLTDEQGRVQALWASISSQLFGCGKEGDHQFVVGIPIYLISQVLEKIISGTPGPFRLINGIRRPVPFVRLLEVEIYPTSLTEARSYGLSDRWVQALDEKDPERRQVLQVIGCFAGSKAETLLEGDMILAIDKKPITCFLDIENACQKLDHSVGSDGMLNMTIFREGKEIDLIVGTDAIDGNGTTRMVNWCGCIVQNPHSAVRALGFLPKEGHGVYVSRGYAGSPIHRYGLYPLQWIVEVNGQPTPDLESFIETVKVLEDGEFVRVRTVQLNGKSRVLALKQDLHYWPTWELNFEPETATWQRRTIKTLQRVIHSTNGN
ncbi:unnamed protein product [Triticum turgidum subsp. durum]|uniref:PDZ-like domain-containing protein n=1 Tax=Triticum turgidum subsp. durum TaxID=4567 RepID=A0A9R0YI53_TRITD|nr:unnamed protein product [Triticum turgidum subsp. durum]